ncbi:hypothetical protein ACFL0M_02085 [Thermodesulfobacteriota bacterium]
MKSSGSVDFVCHTPINSQASKEKVLRPFVNDFTADVLIALGGIAGALEYFRSELEDRLDIPVRPGKVQGAALLGAAKLFYRERTK